ncbi:hypothetical protein NL676_020208 [Syzygium grande]|nr:hypothetical protein NL676_020208 [Syzygium grande]
MILNLRFRSTFLAAPPLSDQAKVWVPRPRTLLRRSFPPTINLLGRRPRSGDLILTSFRGVMVRGTGASLALFTFTITVAPHLSLRTSIICNNLVNQAL